MIMAIKITLLSIMIDIYNIYDLPNSDAALEHMQTWLQQHPTPETTTVIWAGDFNKHHPIWSGPLQV